MTYLQFIYSLILCKIYILCMVSHGIIYSNYTMSICVSHKLTRYCVCVSLCMLIYVIYVNIYYVCLSGYVHVCLCVFVCICVCMQCICVYLCVFVYVCSVFVCICVCIQCICMYLCMIAVYLCMCARI